MLFLTVKIIETCSQENSYHEIFNSETQNYFPESLFQKHVFFQPSDLFPVTSQTDKTEKKIPK